MSSQVFSISTWVNGRFRVESVTQDIPNNQSTYKIYFDVGRKNFETFNYGGNITLVATGPGLSLNTTIYLPITAITGNWVNIYSQTVTTTHNTNGTPTTTAWTFSLNSSVIGWSGSGTMTYALPTIPRYTLLVGPTISSVTRNSYTFSFSTGHTIDRWEYSSNGGAWTLGQTGDRTSGSMTLSPFGANTKPTIKVKVRRKDSQLWIESGVVTVTLEATASPNTPTISGATRNSFIINVTANKSFNGFQYSINNGSTWSGKQSGTSVTVTGRAAGTTHQVRVKVYDGVHTASLSGQSAAASAVTLSTASPNTPTLASRTAIQVVFNWSANQTVTNVQYKRWASDAWQSAGNDFSARTSGSVTVTGLTPNTTWAISVRVKDAVHGTWSGGSGNLSVATYALSTITGSNTTVDTGAKSFAISKAVSSMSQDVILQMWADSQQWINIKSWTNTNGGGFALTASEIASIQDNRTGSNTLTVRYQCTTRWGAGGTVQGTTHSPQYTWTLVGVNPTLSGVTYKDVHSNATFVTWKGGDQKILRNTSQLQITLGTANAIKGAKLVKYVLTVAGKSFTVNATSGVTEQSGAIINAGVVDAGTNQTATIEVFDTRGNKVSRSLTIQMIDWTEPQIIHGTGERLNSYEQPTYLNFLARYPRVLVGEADVNELTAQYRIKVKGSADSTYGAFVNIIAPKGSVNGIWQEVSSSQFMQNLDENTTYTMHIQFKDKVVGWRNYYVDIEMGVGLMEFFEDRIEIGVPLYDKESEKKYLLEGEGLTSVSWSEVIDKPADNQFPNTAQAIGGSQDLNNYTTPGFYYQNANANAASGSNYPTAQAGTLIVTKDAGITQMYYHYHGAGVFYRAFYGSTWTAWQNLLTPAWSAVTGKPSTFAPSTHNHTWSQLSGGSTALIPTSGSSGSWTSVNMSGSKGGYAGVYFTDYARYLMVNASIQGFHTGSAWQWYFSDGSLTAGTVPWARLTSVPTQATRWPTWAEVTSKPSTFTSIATLYSGSIGANSSATMTSMSGYTFLVVVFYWGGSGANRDTMTIPVANISYSTTVEHYSRISWGANLRYGNFSFGSATNIKTYGASEFLIKTIYGVK